MGGKALTRSSVLQCPHGGQVIIQTSNTVTNNQIPLPTQFDTFTVVGCPYQMPAPSGTVPSPCVLVRWVKADIKVKINGVPSLNEQSIGICYSAQQIPQGPVSIVQTQPNIETT